MIISMSYAVNFLNPSAWWGLLGLAIPILIHLLSKKEKHIINFGSLRFLEPLESESAKSIQLSQYLLLAFRMILIGLICFLLVGPFIEEDQENISYWINDEIYDNKDYAPLLANIPEDAIINIYSHEINDSIGIRHFKSSWTLIDYLNKQPDSSVVFTHSLQKGFIGDPTLINNKITWTIVPIKDQPALKHQLGNGKESIEWSINSSPNQLGIVTNISENSNQQDILKLKLINNTTEANAQTLKKVIDLSSESFLYTIEWVSENEDVSIVIDNHHFNNSGHSISWSPSNQILNIQSHSVNSLNISGRIDRESILETNLPVRIAAILNNHITAIIDYDKRVLNPKDFQSSLNNSSINNEKALASATNKYPLHRYVLFLFGLIFVIERFLSYKKSVAS